MQNKYWIYKLTSPSNKIYIGITSNIIKRFNCYYNNNIPNQSKLKASFDKYGFNSFNKEILYTYLSKTEAEQTEIELIKYYKDLKVSLNISNGGETGHCLVGSENSLSKRIYQFDNNGVFIKEWASATFIQKELGFTQSCISKACRTKAFSSYNYLWCFESDFNSGTIPININRAGLKLRIPIVQLDFDLNFIARYESSNEASRILGCSQGNITSCLTKRRNSYLKYVWCYERDYIKNILPAKPSATREFFSKPVLQYDLNGKLINSYKSIKEASIISGCDRSNIFRILRNNKIKPKKYNWEYGKF